MKPKRSSATGSGLGSARYRRYVDAFDHLDRSIGSRYPLEAIAVLDSLIGDRLSSRLGHLCQEEQVATLPCGNLCAKLVGDSGNGGKEIDDGLREIVIRIQSWVRRRNHAIHGTAKILRSNQSAAKFDDLLEQTLRDACDGRELLREFDVIDTRLRKEKGKIPASWPFAFFPEERAKLPGEEGTDGAAFAEVSDRDANVENLT